MEKINVIYIDHSIGDKPGGATLSLYNLILSVKQYVHPIVILRSHGRTEQMFLSIGCETIISPICSNIWENNFKAWIKIIPHIINEQFVKHKLLKNVKKVLNGRKIDIVHSNTSYYNLGFFLAKKLKAKHVWHIREMLDSFFNYRPFWGWKYFYKQLNNSDSIIAITKAVFDNYNLVRFKQAINIWDAVTSANNAVFIEQKENYIFFCAAYISENKGLLDLLKSYYESNVYNDGVRLRIAGIFNNEKYRAKVLKYISSYNLSDYIDFIGYCNDIKTQMMHAKAFVMSSYNEGLGRVAVEAMFYGCPLIARASGGLIEFLKHGENAYLFKNISDCSKYISKVCNSDNKKLITYAQKFAIDNFSEENYGSKIINIYNTIISK